jgi:hypothetical protein
MPDFTARFDTKGPAGHWHMQHMHYERVDTPYGPLIIPIGMHEFGHGDDDTNDGADGVHDTARSAGWPFPNPIPQAHHMINWAEGLCANCRPFGPATWSDAMPGSRWSEVVQGERDNKVADDDRWALWSGDMPLPIIIYNSTFQYYGLNVGVYRKHREYLFRMMGEDAYNQVLGGVLDQEASRDGFGQVAIASARVGFLDQNGKILLEKGDWPFDPDDDAAKEWNLYYGKSQSAQKPVRFGARLVASRSANYWTTGNAMSTTPRGIRAGVSALVTSGWWQEDWADQDTGDRSFNQELARQLYGHTLDLSKSEAEEFIRH